MATITAEVETITAEVETITAEVETVTAEVETDTAEADHRHRLDVEAIQVQEVICLTIWEGVVVLTWVVST